MSKNYNWLLVKTLRSVDQLRLWNENPRLNPEETHLTLADYAEDFTRDKADREDFFELVNSITTDGFVPYDPIIVWKNEDNQKHYVAEGNRRLVALKLLRMPHKAPKSIRSFIRKASNKINITSIEKVPVNVAPTFEDAEWYINQRNSSSSLQRRWTRVQQQRWITSLFEKYNGDIEKLLSVTKLTKSELEGFIRILKIKDFVKNEKVKDLLTNEEYEAANSYKFPITILERFFNFSDVKEKWGLEYEGVDVNILSNKDSFYNAFAALIKRIVNEDEDKINTRLTKDNLDELLKSLPVVLFDESNSTNVLIPEEKKTQTKDTNINSDTKEEGPTSTTTKYLKENPDRNKLILSIYHLNTSSTRLLGLFNELKRISLSYSNTVSASLRIFLDLAVLNYIETEGLENQIKAQYRSDLREVTLKKRLEYIKANKLTGKPQTIVNRLLDESTQYSLDVLNGYVHGQDTHYLNKQFLNGFWDFLFPLFEVLMDIKEDNN